MYLLTATFLQYYIPIDSHIITILYTYRQPHYYNIMHLLISTFLLAGTRTKAVLEWLRLIKKNIKLLNINSLSLMPFLKMFVFKVQFQLVNTYALQASISVTCLVNNKTPDGQGVSKLSAVDNTVITKEKSVNDVSIVFNEFIIEMVL